jgi:hypothetical protein
MVGRAVDQSVLPTRPGSISMIVGLMERLAAVGPLA